MDIKALQDRVEGAWDDRDSITTASVGDYRDAVMETLTLLDGGAVRVAEKNDDTWHVNEWCKKAVLLSFRLNAMSIQNGGPDDGVWWDKVPSKFKGWTASEFEKAGFRAVPTSVVRHSAYVGPGVVLMPSFVNLGAYIDEGTMVDTWATVGSCAQIGKNVHLSGGAGIGGVLEPLQAGPVIIEDNCFIGARSEVVEGVVVEEGQSYRWVCSSGLQQRSSIATQVKYLWVASLRILSLSLEPCRASHYRTDPLDLACIAQSL